MIVELGAEHRFDATHRALVAGIVDVSPDSGSLDERVGMHLLDARADAVCLRPLQGACDPATVAGAVRTIRVRSDLPVLVETPSPVVAAAAFDAGANGVRDVSAFSHPDMLRVCASARASVVAVHTPLGPPAPVSSAPGSSAHAGSSADAGSSAHAGPTSRAAVDHLARRVAAALDAGIPLERTFVEVADAAGPVENVPANVACSSDEPGVLVAAIAAGCRLLLVRDVRAARRIAAVVAALLASREEVAA